MKQTPGDELAWQMQHALDEQPEREVYFAKPRMFRFDFAFRDQKLAIEVNGGVWKKKARHQTGIGFTRDCVKRSLAAIHGWRVIEVTPAHIQSGEALQWIEAALCTTTRTRAGEINPC